MSIRVKNRLQRMRIETTHKERVELDKRIEERTGKYCDEGVDDLTDEEIRQLLEDVRKWLEALRRKKRRGEPVAAYA